MLKKAVWIAVGSMFFLLLAILIAPHFVDLGYFKRTYLPLIEESLNRRLDVGEVRLRLVPTPSIQLSQLKIFDNAPFGDHMFFSAEQVRLRHRALADEREALARASLLGLMPEDPHAHLHHRALPNVAPVRVRERVLRVWSNVSASLLLAGCAVIVLGVGGPLLPALAGLAVVILCTEAFARGHLLQFIAGLLALAVAGAAIWLITLAAIGHWRVAAAILFVLAALALLLVNVRDFFSKR